MRTNLRVVAGTFWMVVTGTLFSVAATLAAAEQQPTPVVGESWLQHLHRPFDVTSMGKTGRLGPPPTDEAPTTQAAPGTLGKPVILRGSDIYRLNCRSCHGEAGLGAPPEIHSVVDPVRATSALLIRARMHKSGMDMSPASAAEMAKEAQVALLQRLHHGGESMPAFPHLNDGEIRALIAYLKQLAGTGRSEDSQLVLQESSLRVGEQIVKSTCHTCHDATGADPSYQQLEAGAIPPLATLTTRTSQTEFVRKVTQGAPIVMGTPPTPHRGRMPVFYFLNADEAADVYLFLTQYPPVPATNDEQQTPAGMAASMAPLASGGGPSQTREGPDRQDAVLLMAVAVLVALLLSAGLAFTRHEFKRLSAKSREKQPRRVPAPCRERNAVPLATR